MKTLRLLSLILLACISAHPLRAHPVSQGAMDIKIYDDRIDLRATVSLEQVLVSAALNGNDKTIIGDSAIRDHGAYLLDHLWLGADGRPVSGRLLETPSQLTGRLTYRIEFKLKESAAKRLEFRQNILREFIFAPGNPWEASYIVRIGLSGQRSTEGLLFTFREPLIFDANAGSGQRVLQFTGAFVKYGIEHILTGYDHLLFVAALVLAATGWIYLIKVIAVFTLAHTLTLVLSVLNIIRLSSGIVEPVIAASIVAVAAQNIFWPESSHGRSRILLAFGFGLFHGLGFAGGLLDAMSGMAVSNVTLAIIAFSAGVEIGHLLVVLPSFYGLTYLSKAEYGSHRLNSRIQRYGSVVISMFGLVYFYSALQ